MKKIILALLLISLCLLTSGCWKYGKGESVGYTYAVDDGIVWDKVWFKPSLQSSESDCYLIKDDALKQQIRDLPQDTKIKIYYDRHFITIAMCPEGTGTDDEIVRYEILS